MFVPTSPTHIARNDIHDGVNIANLVGSMFIGNILNWMLFGALIMQLNTYYQNYPNDRLALKIFVYFVFFLDVVQTVLLTHHGWWWIITTWCEPQMFTQVVWSAPVIPFMSGLISAVVQVFYAWRIWTLTRTSIMRAICVLIVLLAVMQSTIAMVSGLIVSQNPVLSTLLGLSKEFSTWLAGSFVADIIITMCMTYILVQARNKSAWGPTETLLTKLINRIIQSGAATVIIAAIDLGLFVTVPDTNYYFVPSYILAKIYSNSLMLNLNLRRPNGNYYVTEQSSNILPLSALRGEPSGLQVRVQQTTQNDTKWTVGSEGAIDPTTTTQKD
ncbi:hypothetical protein C8R46DRAFT_1062556 [Mycena filopes]|nr:hypothetical protein C8R46DRAFT_1062556 [Mycena filopes]